MKTLLLLLMIIWGYKVQSQHWLSYTGSFVAGLGDGTAEALRNHYSKTPFKNHQYWDPGVSWTNKYKNGDPTQGPRFPLSTTAFVWTTDGYHMSRMVRNSSFMVSIVFHPHEKKKWTGYLLDVATHYLMFQAGFNLMYEVVLK